MKYMVPLCLMILILCFGFALLPLSGENAVYDNVVRLHVIANSDSDKDQILKYEVRDEILENLGFLSDTEMSRENMLVLLDENKEEIKAAAEKIIAENGENYDVSVYLGEEYYPTRVYDGVNMPAGRYVSLKVRLGEAQGQNWWCVLYPQICNNTAKAGDTLIKSGFTSEQMEILTNNDNPKYVIKFKILEFFQNEIKI